MKGLGRTTGVRAAFRKWFFLDEKDGDVSVRKKVVVRLQVLLYVSIALNIFCFWGLSSVVPRVNLNDRIVSQAAEISEDANQLSVLFGMQIEDLAAAYQHYGESVTEDEQLRRQAYNAYRDRHMAFVGRQDKVEAVRHRIRERAEAIARLYEGRVE